VESVVVPKPTDDDWRRGMVDPVFFAQRFLTVTPHEGQRCWLDNASARENILVTGNRWGKSFVSAVKLIHHAVYRPRPLKYDAAGRYRAVVASITQDQANLVFTQVLRLVRQSSIIGPLLYSVVRTPFPTATFGNGATIEARSTQNRGEYLLGNDYDMFVFDEVAFETDPEYVVEEVILMRLADRAGRLDLVSTPNGRNWFYRRAMDIVKGRRPGYYQTGDSRQNLHISRAYLDERVRYFSDARLKQNIMGQFVDAAGQIIPGIHIDRALGRMRSWRQPAAGHFITGWDLARKRTATVGITIDVSDGVARVIAVERLKLFDWSVILERIKARQHEYPGRLVIDATGLGDVIVDQLAEYKPEPVIFTPATKAELLTNVELFHARDAVAYDRWELPDGPGRVWALEDELRQARWDDNNACDSLMALALALWPLRRRTQPMIRPRIGKV
jgi:hypothetical protein